MYKYVAKRSRCKINIYFWRLINLTMSRSFLDRYDFENKSKIERKNHMYKVRLVKALVSNNGMTNASICKHLKISAPKTLELINSLADAGILEQNEKGSSIGGRKPILNKLKGNTFFILCVEVELFRVKMTIVDNTSHFVHARSSSFLLSKDWSSALELTRLLTDFIQ